MEEMMCILHISQLSSWKQNKQTNKKKAMNNYAWLKQKLVFIDVRWYQMMKSVNSIDNIDE